MGHGYNPTNKVKGLVDPCNTGTKLLDGKDFNHPIYVIDAALDQIIYPDSNVCDSTITPEIVLRNNGSANITSADIYYKIDNGNYVKNSWKGNLLYMYTTTVTLNPISFTKGTHVFKVYVTNPNNSVDSNPTNDTLSDVFKYINGEQISITLKTDYWADEISWIVKDSAKNILLTNGPLSSDQIYNSSACLPPGCYDFIIYDSGDDGMCDFYPSIDTGYVKIYAWPNTFTISGCNYDSSYTLKFCVTAGINNLTPLQKTIKIYPNPAMDKVNIEYNSPVNKPVEGEIYSLYGNVIKRFYLTSNNLITLNSK